LKKYKTLIGRSKQDLPHRFAREKDPQAGRSFGDKAAEGRPGVLQHKAAGRRNNCSGKGTVIPVRAL